ncbi:phosphatidate cytidylyltransferase [bacterium A37T11]|nr:phosphatidate cytidylyltransferase [bacterium A37T11]
MLTRAITGFFFVLVMLGAVLTGAYAFSGFFIVLGLLCTDEFYRLLGHDAGTRPHRWLGLLAGLTFFGSWAATFLWQTPGFYLLLGVPVFSLIFITELYLKNRQPFMAIGYTFLGLVYAFLPFVFFFSLGFLTGEYRYAVPLGFLIMLWSNDTGAYLAGRSFGKHHLFERHSPKKTWEGFAGGVLLAIVASLVLAHFFQEIASWQWLGCALIISVIGTFGDLTESMLKRSLNVKDSGSLLPGHGGLLDRFDGLLLAAPLVYVFLRLSLL